MPTTQTRLRSFVESLTNVAVGWAVALASQLVIFPLFDIHVPIRTNLWISIWFTGISIVRSYCIRRWFSRRDGATLFEEDTNG